MNSVLERWKARLKKFSHDSNVLLLAAQLLKERDHQEMAAELPRALGRAGGRSVASGIKMKPGEISLAMTNAVGAAVDLLLVRLEAELHAHLQEANGYDPDDHARSLEMLCASVRPSREETLSGEKTDYREVILLSCIRNAVVHGDGTVRWSRFGKRLAAAGWVAEAVTGRTCLNGPRSLEDLLHFKRVVRSVATQQLASSGVATSKLRPGATQKARRGRRSQRATGS